MADGRGLVSLPCTMMRGGTSRGVFFRSADLPDDPARRDQVLIAALGAPHPLQVDGIGGGHPLTSKVAIVGPPSVPNADVDYLFAQVNVDRASVDTSPTCGNLLAAVGPFALETGLIRADAPVTAVHVHHVNTGAISTALLPTPGRVFDYAGDCLLPGLSHPAAPIRLSFEDAPTTGEARLLPTGLSREIIHGVEVTLAAYAVPVMIVGADGLGIAGDETPADLNSRPDLFKRIEALRLEAGRRMGLGDVSGSVTPKVAIVSPARNGGSLTSRYLMPWKAHSSHAVTGALCLAAAATVEGSLPAALAGLADPHGAMVHIEHPEGTLSVELSTDDGVLRGSIVRTARKLFVGEVFVPAQVFAAPVAERELVEAAE
ncbi:MAG: 4-oxalomesaconate tautomerase [Bauldia sp.]|nr:4-oxalomesaconate tautomerase [Bauldia sp.]